MTSVAPDALPPLVSATWLASRLHVPDLVVLDCSWYLPTSGRDPELEYRATHIPGAVRFDLDRYSAPDTPLPHMLPSPEQFASAMEELGIHPEDRVVCYDGSGLQLSAARVWWMFRVFGHRSVAVLDGGFPSWASETRPVQRGVVRRSRSGYRVPEVNRSLVLDQRAVESLIARGVAQLVDCRPAERFAALVDEPRPEVARGSIPGSRNLPYAEFTDPNTGRLREPRALRALLVDHGIDPAKPIVAYCGSGTSACVLALAEEVLRFGGDPAIGPPVAIYDGSWSEWGWRGG